MSLRWGGWDDEDEEESRGRLAGEAKGVAEAEESEAGPAGSSTRDKVALPAVQLGSREISTDRGWPAK